MRSSTGPTCGALASLPGVDYGRSGQSAAFWLTDPPKRLASRCQVASRIPCFGLPQARAETVAPAPRTWFDTCPGRAARKSTDIYQYLAECTRRDSNLALVGTSPDAREYRVSAGWWLPFQAPPTFIGEHRRGGLFGSRRYDPALTPISTNRDSAMIIAAVRSRACRYRRNGCKADPEHAPLDGWFAFTWPAQSLTADC